MLDSSLNNLSDYNIFRTYSESIKTDEDMDNRKGNGISVISDYTSENAYPTNGILLHFSINQNRVIQISVPYHGSGAKLRTYWFTKWYDWRDL